MTTKTQWEREAMLKRMKEFTQSIISQAWKIDLVASQGKFDVAMDLLADINDDAGKLEKLIVAEIE